MAGCGDFLISCSLYVSVRRGFKGTLMVCCVNTIGTGMPSVPMAGLTREYNSSQWALTIEILLVVNR